MITKMITFSLPVHSICNIPHTRTILTRIFHSTRTCTSSTHSTRPSILWWNGLDFEITSQNPNPWLINSPTDKVVGYFNFTRICALFWFIVSFPRPVYIFSSEVPSTRTKLFCRRPLQLHLHILIFRVRLDEKVDGWRTERYHLHLTVIEDRLLQQSITEYEYDFVE